MNKEDNILLQVRHLQMELVRMTNELARRDEYERFLEEEVKNVAEETRKDCAHELDLLKTSIANITREKDEYKQRAELAEKELAEYKAKNKEMQSELDSLQDIRKIAEEVKKANGNAKDIIKVFQSRDFQRKSDATRFLNGEIDLGNPYVEEMGMKDLIDHLMKATSEHNDEAEDSKQQTKEKVDLPEKKGKDATKQNKAKPRHNVFSKYKRIYSATELKLIGLDVSNLPKGAKLIRRKDKEGGYDVWYLRLAFYIGPKTVCREYKIGRFNIPKGDPMCSVRPKTIIGTNPIMPSFARFYFMSKIRFCLSENRVLDILNSMKTKMSQQSLNFWMHQIMAVLRERLEPLMLEAIRQSKFTNNDGTRLLVRSKDADGKTFKYKIEYIQAALSLEKKLCVMLYDEGSRGHELQEEKVFKGSSIECFVADGAPQYKEIVDDLDGQGQQIKRQACWFHARHYFVDAYIVDKRVEGIIQLINGLFYIERMFHFEEDQSPESRMRWRLKWSRRLVSRIFEKLETIRSAGKEYGEMVHRAVDYVLNDKDAFQKFLLDGRIDMHNIAIERCFRHIALGRRNWQQSGSHDAAKNIAFMFGLYESCKLNDLDFGEYIEDVLTRIMYGEEVDASFLPVDYVRKYEDGQDNKDASAKDPKEEVA